MQRELKFNLDVKNQKSWSITDEGFLDCRATLTRAGIFDYYENGGLVRELRPESEVFKPESMATARMLPITFSHPNGKVDGANFKKFTVGITGDSPKKAGKFLESNIRIMDGELVKSIMEKRGRGESVELSMGYDSILIDQQGETDEGHYDKIQTDIRYNHVSIVDKGRAGAEVRLKLDTKKGVKSMSKIKVAAVKVDGYFHMDAIEVEVEDATGNVQKIADKLGEATVVISGQKEKLDEITQEKSTVQAKCDEHEAEAKKHKEKIDELSNPASDTIQAMIKDRVALEKLAGDLKIDPAGKSNQDIQLAVIKSVHTDFDETGKDAAYLQARFDAVTDSIKTVVDKEGISKLTLLRNDALKKGGDDKPSPRADFIEQSEKMAKGK